MRFRAKLFIAIIISGCSFQTISAQSIDYNNQIEFSDNEFEDDLNSIDVLSKPKVRAVKQQVVKEEVSLADLATILENKRLHYRNVRKPAEKCFRESEEVCAAPKK